MNENFDFTESSVVESNYKDGLLINLNSYTMSKTFIVIIILVLVLLFAYFLFVPQSSPVPPAIPAVNMEPATTSTQAATTTATTTESSEFKVSIQNFSFSPAIAVIKSGTTIVWINNDSVNHSVDGGNVFKSGILQPGDTYSYTFNGSGTLNYSCSIHPSMKGKIIVQAS